MTSAEVKEYLIKICKAYQYLMMADLMCIDSPSTKLPIILKNLEAELQSTRTIIKKLTKEEKRIQLAILKRRGKKKSIVTIS